MKSKSIRGMNDILPDESATWLYLESIVQDVVESYGYQQIRLPVLEYTALFKRSIGEATDIVEKEMYTFEDRNGESLTLRPEATASMVRAGITNGLFHNQRQKLWTAGPMFRYEKPQKGRYRQFHQFDVEAMGFPGPDVDAELIIMCSRLWERLGLQHIRLEINSLGSQDSRARYRNDLVKYFTTVKKQLDEDSIRRLDKNPLRILDSKNPEIQEIIAAAPVMLDYLDAEAASHFEGLKSLLDAAGVSFTVNPRLVRGLDYYNLTVFEWVTDKLGAQGAVCSGGRYDGLVEKLGGRATPAIGWAMGMERLVALFEACDRTATATRPAVYIVAAGDAAQKRAFEIGEMLRSALPEMVVELNLGGGSFKSQLKRADKRGAAVALILGEEEVAKDIIAVKPLRSFDDQMSVPVDEVAAVLKERYLAER